jgi:hypothetical protein
MKVRRFFYRIYLSLKTKFNQVPPVKDEERICFNILMRIVKNEKSELIFTPISNKRLIRNEEKDMYISIQHRTIHVINHIYRYTVYMESDILYYSIIDLFDNTLEGRRHEAEIEMDRNIKHSLSSILDTI